MGERALVELLYGEGSHANTLGCVEDVGLDAAGRTADGFPHSIAQLVGHMNFWMAYELRRIADENPPYPEHAAAGWPASASPRTAEEWRRAIDDFRENLARLKKLAESPPEILAREVGATHASHKKMASSVEAVVWQMAVHNSYHTGQIALLRRSLGIWPPRTGGDTW